MKKFTYLVLVIFFLLACSTMAEINTELRHPSTITAFVNVHVVPMDSERIINNQTVIVKNGIITDIGNNKIIIIPEKAVIVRRQNILDTLS